MARSIRSSTSRPRAMKYCSSVMLDKSRRRSTYTIPVVHLVEPRTRNDKGQRLQLLFTSLGVNLAVHSEGKNTWHFVERLDKGGVIALWRELDNFQVEIGLVGRAECQFTKTLFTATSIAFVSLTSSCSIPSDHPRQRERRFSTSDACSCSSGPRTPPPDPRHRFGV